MTTTYNSALPFASQKLNEPVPGDIYGYVAMHLCSTDIALMDIYASSENIANVLFLFELILYVPSILFQLCRDGSSCGEPVLS